MNTKTRDSFFTMITICLPIIAVVLAVVAVACHQNTAVKAEAEPVRTHSIEPLASRYLSSGSTIAYVFDVDGHEYVAVSGAGVIHSEACPCKTKKELK